MDTSTPGEVSEHSLTGRTLYPMPDDETVGIFPPIRICIGDCRYKLSKIVCDPRVDEGGEVRSLYISVLHEKSLEEVRRRDIEMENMLRSLASDPSTSLPPGLKYSPLLRESGDDMKKFPPCMNIMLRKECTTAVRWMRQTSEENPEFAECCSDELKKGVRVYCEAEVNCLSINREKGTIRPFVVARLVLADTKHWSSEVVQCPFNCVPFKMERIDLTEEEIVAGHLSKAVG